MIHTQYYALMRALAQAIQSASPNTTINQWDYNYNSKTFDSVKLHRNPQPYPKGIINISSVQKQFTYPLAQNASVGTNAADLVQFPNAFPIASVVDKFEIYGLTNRYNINVSITVNFETSAQMLDFYHNYTEYFPSEGKFFYDFEYDYYLYLPQEIINGYDPSVDDAVNIFAQVKDDASNYDLYAKCVSTPVIRCESVNMNQDKKSEIHSVNINFNVQDSFVYLLMKIDSKYWIRGLSLSINIKVLDTDNSEKTIQNDKSTIDGSKFPDWVQDANDDQLGDSLTADKTTNNNTSIKKVT